MKIEKKYLTAPLTAQLEITDLCNHRCIHCYNLDSAVENRPTRKVTDETVIACAQKLIDSGIFSVIVTGGEPLIKKELTKKVIILFRENNIRVNLNTNLTLFDDDFIAFLKELRIGVLTSCPSAIPTSFERLVGIDNFEKFETNIKKMVSAGVRFTVNMVITKDNLREIRTTAKKIKKLGCKTFAATPMGLNMDYPRLDLLLSINEVRNVIADLLWIKENLGLNVDILEALPKCIFPEKILTEKHSFLNRKCQAGRTVIAVSNNGDVRPCAHNQISYGNILETDLKEIWTKMDDWRSSQYVPDECQNCTWLNRCNGGCRTSAKTINNEWNSKDMWATKPLALQAFKQNKQIELKPETQLQINSNYKSRREDENVFVIYNVVNDIYFMVNKIYYDFITEFNENNIFTFENLQKKYNVTTDNKDFYDVVLFLVKKKILNIIV